MELGLKDLRFFTVIMVITVKLSFINLIQWKDSESKLTTKMKSLADMYITWWYTVKCFK